MTKRIAVQMFGHLRSFKKTYQSFLENVIAENLKDGYETDVFIHTWDEKDHSTATWHNQEGKDPINKVLTEKDIELVKQIYNPKKLLIEPQLEYEEKIIIEVIDSIRRSIRGCLNASYTIYKTNELRKEYEKENNIKYDWVIHTRPDVAFNSSFRLDDFLSVYEKYGINIPDNALFHACNPFQRGKIQDPRLIVGTDIIYFAAPENMNKATQLYLTWEKTVDPNNFICFEMWFTDFWRAQGLQPMEIDYKLGPGYAVIRNNEPEDVNND